MGSRPLMLASLLGASIGVPYVMSQSSQGTKPNSPPPAGSPYFGGQTSQIGPVGGASALMSPQLLARPGAATTAASPPLEGARFHSIAEVLRFDVTKEWVYSNWARKSTGLADPELYGVRVPLVTGTSFADLAGSLTYAFNGQGQVQHISFLGRTADTTPLVQFLTTTYQLERRDAPAGEQLYQVGSGDQVQSELRTRPESVLWSASPHGSFVVELELERAGSNRYLPSRVPKLAIPPAGAAPANGVAGANGSGATPASDSGQGGADQPSFYDKLKRATYDNVRHATPAEDNQVQWKRWPN
jgi:Family of unknown function (DUF6690)